MRHDIQVDEFGYTSKQFSLISIEFRDRKHFGNDSSFLMRKLICYLLKTF